MTDDVDVKLPWPDDEVVAAAPPSWHRIAPTTMLWRLHDALSDHPVAWNALRRRGPLPTARFDPWEPPEADRPDGVAYLGLDWPTCLAEVFQVTRVVEVRPGRRLLITGFRPTRELSLLDLRGEYPIRAGASHLLNSGPRPRCRAWAAALRRAHPESDGLLYTGMAGRACVALYVDDAFGAAPDFCRQLDDPAIAADVADAVDRIGYGLRGWS